MQTGTTWNRFLSTGEASYEYIWARLEVWELDRELDTNVSRVPVQKLLRKRQTTDQIVGSFKTSTSFLWDVQQMAALPDIYLSILRISYSIIVELTIEMDCDNESDSLTSPNIYYNRL